MNRTHIHLIFGITLIHSSAFAAYYQCKTTSGVHSFRSTAQSKNLATYEAVDKCLNSPKTQFKNLCTFNFVSCEEKTGTLPLGVACQLSVGTQLFTLRGENQTTTEEALLKECEKSVAIPSFCGLFKIECLDLSQLAFTDIFKRCLNAKRLY